MSLCITLTFPFGTFDAATDNRFRAEWPPSPARLLSGLRAGADGDAEIQALQWLEEQDAPRIVATERPLASRQERSYVVTNRVREKGLNQQHPGRTATLRRRDGVTLADEHVVFSWPDAKPTSAVLKLLDKLAARLPYFGRSTSVVIASAHTELDSKADGWFEPVSFGRDTIAVSAPSAGMMNALAQAFDTGARAWETYRQVPYRYVRAERAPAAVRPAAAEGHFRDLLVFGFAPGVHLAGGLLGHVTSALRRAVMNRVADPLPPAISGHGAHDRPHAAFLGLPYVGSAHSDGHLLGVAVAVPNLTEPDLQALARGLLGDPGLRSLHVPQIGKLPLKFDPSRRRPRGLMADRWCAPSEQWVTATPIVLDRHPRRHEDPADVVAAGCVTAGYPEPIAVETSRQPLLEGATNPRPNQVPRRSGDRRPYLHARMIFDRPVRGPVLLGGLRYLGFGLCLPLSAGVRS